MTQNLGSTSNPLSMTGEQWVLEERTDDPLSPEPGECWIRSDLNAGDKIATLKFGDGSEVPIFPTGTSEPGVLEVRRVQTGGQTGYLPVADLDFATFPQLRLQHNNTVYGLHNDIEDSVVLQYFATEVSGGDSTWSDDNEIQNMTLTTGETDSSLSDNSESLNFDGENDHGLINLPSDFEGSGLTEFSIEFVLEFSHSDRDSLISHRNDGQELRVRPNEREGFNADAGNISFVLEDTNGQSINCAPSTNPGINDGQRHDISITVKDSTQNDVSIIIDGNDEALTFDSQDGPDNFGSWTNDCPIAARSIDGAIDDQFALDIGAIRWHNEGISDQTIGGY